MLPLSDFNVSLLAVIAFGLLVFFGAILIHGTDREIPQ